jgi:hypothetical protein
MDIGQPIRELGAVDIDPLSKAILELTEPSWREEEIRQKKYQEVHYNTQSLVMIFCDHDNWPNIDVVKGASWTQLSQFALPLMHDIIAQSYTPGGTIIRAMAAKLTAGTTITSHTDHHQSFHHGHRIHVPITTNNKVRFMIDGRPYRLKVGQAYEINNQKMHGVINSGDEDRITFIFDYLPRKEALNA